MTALSQNMLPDCVGSNTTRKFTNEPKKLTDGFGAPLVAATKNESGVSLEP
jgi:hypothetical protein